MAAWYSGHAVNPACSCSRMTLRTSSGWAASSSSQSATHRIMLAGLPHKIRLTSSGRRSSTYCMASMPPQELPNRCSRSRPSILRDVTSSSMNRSTVHSDRSSGLWEFPQPS